MVIRAKRGVEGLDYQALAMVGGGGVRAHFRREWEVELSRNTPGSA
jgi:hypothetical protein